jgi:hypothetical protein
LDLRSAKTQPPNSENTHQSPPTNPKKPKATLRHYLLLAASSLLAISHSQAVDYTWVGGTGNWSDASWNPGPVSGPTSVEDTATNNSETVSLNVASMNVGSLTLGAGASFHAYMIWIIITSKHHEGFAVSK